MNDSASGQTNRRESDPVDGEQKAVITKPQSPHQDLVRSLRIIIPGLVAMSVIFSYLTQVIMTGNTDSELGSSLPVIVSAYFILHVSEKRTIE